MGKLNRDVEKGNTYSILGISRPLFSGQTGLFSFRLFQVVVCPRQEKETRNYFRRQHVSLWIFASAMRKEETLRRNRVKKRQIKYHLGHTSIPVVTIIVHAAVSKCRNARFINFDSRSYIR